MSDELGPEHGFDAWYAEHQSKAPRAWFERKSTLAGFLGLLGIAGCVVIVPSRSGQSTTVAATSPPNSSNELASENVAMRFDDCVDHIGTMAGKLGITPINIVETRAMRMVRLPTSDGSVLITCSAADDTMVVTRSPYS